MTNNAIHVLFGIKNHDLSGLIIRLVKMYIKLSIHYSLSNMYWHNTQVHGLHL